MFQDLDSTLTRILNDEAMKVSMMPPLTELFDADVTFITPDRAFPPTVARGTVNLFLYDVKENRELRDPVPIVEKVGNGFRSRIPPVRIDCSYIVTAWSNAAGDNQVVEEHRLLAQALLWLTRFPGVPTKYLQGGLTNQPFPLTTTVAQMDANKNAGEFWSALGIPPRSAFYLTVTIAMDVGVQETGSIVTTRFTGFVPGFGNETETLVQIGGRVLAHEVTAVRAQANVVNAAASGNQATVTNPGDAANFLGGDIVLLDLGPTTELATVATINGATITFEANLTNSFNGGTIRIADLLVGRRSFRVTSMAGIQTGVAVRIAQAATREEQIVQEVDRARNVLTLTSGLTNTYLMGAAAQPVNIASAVAGAFVSIVDVQLRTQSTADGRFTFPRVPAGTHVIETLAVGFQPKTQPLTVPGRAEDYEITLTPLP
jgi:Pvc16 N-terminal domain/Carboxypeptidase regulatory-like domain